MWSAAPTPLTADLRVDEASVARMVDAAVAEGLGGLFVAGTCGEGPWLPDRERQRLFRATVRAAARRVKVAAQVSDNSVPRILDNIAIAAEAGIDYAMIAPPATMLNATPERIVGLFAEAVAASPLPVGIYDLVGGRVAQVPIERLKEIYLLPNVHLVKDSSSSPERRWIALAARAAKPSLVLFNGNEFRCLEYLQAGYNGCLFGGAVAVAAQMALIADLFLAGRLDAAAAADAEMRRTLHGIYGGEQIACWLTGLKHYLVCRGLFATSASFLGYPLTPACRAFIEAYASTQSHLHATDHRVGVGVGAAQVEAVLQDAVRR
jgi:4-hydroxy-tetrahydrodipicolinate synthase